MRAMRAQVLIVSALLAACGASAAAAREPDVIYVPTPQELVEDMLRLADVKRGDVLYDLGSGDGRIPVTAAKKYGIRAVGIDIDPQRIREAHANARRKGVTSLVTFRRQDLFEADFREATVVTLYLLPDLNLRLRPQLLKQLRPGTRVVSHQFDMGDWKPDKTLESNGRTVYFWVVPARP
jgi:ribosomal protein L11 methylase PrmA